MFLNKFFVFITVIWMLYGRNVLMSVIMRNVWQQSNNLIQKTSICFICRKKTIYWTFRFRFCRWRKRGLALVPTKFGLAFTFTTLNQVCCCSLNYSKKKLLTIFNWFTKASALVHIYTDGSVLVNHGGIEMGQVRMFWWNVELCK